MAKRKSGHRAGPASTLAAQMALAPMVAAMRLPQMMREGQGLAPVSTETIGAVTEKATAAAEGMVAAQMSLLGSMMRFWPEMLSGKVPSLLSGAAAEHSIRAALEPAGRQVSSNFRRLSRRR